MFDVSFSRFYHGKLSRQEAEDVLRGHAPNSWLVRYSEKEGKEVISMNRHHHHGTYQDPGEMPAPSGGENFRFIHRIIHKDKDGSVYLKSKHEKSDPFMSVGELLSFYMVSGSSTSCSLIYQLELN